MRLQLDPTQSYQYAQEAGPYTTFEAALQAIFKVFKDNRHDPFTRKDVCAVLSDMGGGLDPINDKIPGSTVEGWRVINPALKQFPSTGKGFYTQFKMEDGVDAVLTPIEAPPLLVIPSVQAKVEVSPSITQEIDLESFYRNDIGLRRQAAADTACFGHHSPRHAVCLECPLSRFCISAAEASFSDVVHDLDLASELAMKTVMAEGRINPSTPDTSTQRPPRPAQTDTGRYSNPPPTPAPTPEPLGLDEIDRLLKAKYGEGGYSTLTLPFAGVCSKCDKQMAVGEKVIHDPGKGMVHIPCAIQVSA